MSRIWIYESASTPRALVRSIARSRSESPIYWFNDMDYHGVEPDPFFRYSIRVDGVFERSFVKRLQQAQRR